MNFMFLSTDMMLCFSSIFDEYSLASGAQYCFGRWQWNPFVRDKKHVIMLVNWRCSQKALYPLSEASSEHWAWRVKNVRSCSFVSFDSSVKVGRIVEQMEKLSSSSSFYWNRLLPLSYSNYRGSAPDKRIQRKKWNWMLFERKSKLSAGVSISKT